MIELVKLSHDTLQDAYNDGHSKGFQTGFTNGYNNGYSVGNSKGRTERYNEFWKAYLQLDEDGLIDASYAFAGNCWKPEILKTNDKPRLKYKNTSYMYYKNKNLTDMWFWTHNTENTNTDSNYMYSGCENLKRIIQFRMSPLETTAIDTFKGCSSLHTINAFWFNGNVKTYKDVFKGCTSLKTINAYKRIDGTGLNFTDCPLSVSSMTSIISCLYRQPEGTTKTITFGTKNLNKLTAAQKASATGKGWTLK